MHHPRNRRRPMIKLRGSWLERRAGRFLYSGPYPIVTSRVYNRAEPRPTCDFDCRTTETIESPGYVGSRWINAKAGACAGLRSACAHPRRPTVALHPGALHPGAQDVDEQRADESIRDAGRTRLPGRNSSSRRLGKHIAHRSISRDEFRTPLTGSLPADYIELLIEPCATVRAGATATVTDDSPKPRAVPGVASTPRPLGGSFGLRQGRRSR